MLTSFLKTFSLYDSLILTLNTLPSCFGCYKIDISMISHILHSFSESQIIHQVQSFFKIIFSQLCININVCFYPTFSIKAFWLLSIFSLLIHDLMHVLTYYFWSCDLAKDFQLFERKYPSSVSSLYHFIKSSLTWDIFINPSKTTYR